MQGSFIEAFTCSCLGVDELRVGLLVGAGVCLVTAI
jgi:hypothetical protein